MTEDEKEHLKKLQNALIEGKIDQAMYEKLKQDMGITQSASLASRNANANTHAAADASKDTATRGDGAPRKPRMLVPCHHFLCYGLAVPGFRCSICGANARTVREFLLGYCKHDLWREMLIGVFLGAVPAIILGGAATVLIEKLSGQKWTWGNEWGNMILLGAVMLGELYVPISILRQWKYLSDEERIRAVQAAGDAHGSIRLVCLAYVPPGESKWSSQTAEEPSNQDEIDSNPGVSFSFVNDSIYEITAITLHFSVFAQDQEILTTWDHSARGEHHWAVRIPPRTTTHLVWRFLSRQKRRVETANRLSIQIQPRGIRLKGIIVDGKEHRLSSNPLMDRL